MAPALRKATFINWPCTKGSYYRPEDLATAGFRHYAYPYDLKCRSCNLGIDGSKIPYSITPIQAHVASSPKCQFLRGMLGKDVIQAILEKAENWDFSVLEKELEELPTIKLETKDYRELSVRLKSFEAWPFGKPDFRFMAARGEYYTGVYDRVRCYACKYDQYDWYRTDDRTDYHTDCII
jgi:Inhibitor of Apoptosis domain